jgi:hypothetical protein
MNDELNEHSALPGRRKALLKGGAAVAAGAAAITLLKETPAAASTGANALGPIETPSEGAFPLHQLDFGAETPTFSEVTFGSGGISKLRLTAVGSLGFLEYRCVFGSGATFNTSSTAAFGLYGGDFDLGEDGDFTPAAAGTDIKAVGQLVAGGGGVITDNNQSPNIAFVSLCWYDMSGADIEGIDEPVLGINLPGIFAEDDSSWVFTAQNPWSTGPSEAAQIYLSMTYELANPA